MLNTLWNIFLLISVIIGFIASIITIAESQSWDRIATRLKSWNSRLPRPRMPGLPHIGVKRASTIGFGIDKSEGQNPIWHLFLSLTLIVLGSLAVLFELVAAPLGIKLQDGDVNAIGSIGVMVLYSGIFLLVRYLAEGQDGTVGWRVFLLNVLLFALRIPIFLMIGIVPAFFIGGLVYLICAGLFILGTWIFHTPQVVVDNVLLVISIMAIVIGVVYGVVIGEIWHSETDDDDTSNPFKEA